MIRFAVGLMLLLSLSHAAFAGPVSFVKPDVIRYDRQCFTINGKDTYIFSGEFHYFRCPKALWEDRLLKYKRAGLNAIDIYVPWNWHERVQGKPDMRDLDDLLTLCEKMGLMVMVRPGPYICAEWDIGGFPRWLPVKQIGFRSDSEASRKWSDYWYSIVMPVVAKHQITRGGCVIMVQVENEYDACGRSDSEMTNYIKSLYKSARKYGIEVPIFTCWTRVARKNDDPVMSQIMDTCNFYPGWDFQGPKNALELLRRQEPGSPLMVTELQGGWFSTFGGKAPDKQPFSPQQINALTKSVLAYGLTASSYYMFFGGTNFGYWGARHITTTYDYQAPLAEPGGIWDKYYSVKLIGDFLKTWGSVLVRAEPVRNGASADADSVSVWERANGKTAFVFVRNEKDEWKRAKVTYTDPSTGRKADEPLDVLLSPRDMKILPVNAPIPGGTIKWCNGEVQSAVRVGHRTVVTIYGDEDPQKEHKLQAAVEIGGKTVVSSAERIQADGAPVVREEPGLTVVFLDRKKAGSTWVVPYRDSNVLMVTDAYLLRSWMETRDSLEVDLDTLPGWSCSVYLISDPKDESIRLKTPDLPVEPAVISSVRVKLDPLGDGTGWRKTELQSLDSMGIFENGCTRYKASFENSGQTDLLLSSYAPDPRLVFLNGRLVSEGDGSRVRITKPGRNVVEVLYENPGRVNGGAAMEEVKGLREALLLDREHGSRSLSVWRASKSGPPASDPAEARPDFDDSSWTSVEVGKGWQDFMNGYRGWAWYRTTFDAPESRPGYCSLLFEGVDDNCAVYLNGRKVEEHTGWNSPFVLSELSKDLRTGRNVLAVAVQNVDGPGGIHKPVTLRIGDKDFGRTDGWMLAVGTYGQSTGWMKPGFDDADWTVQPLGPETKDFSFRRGNEPASPGLSDVTSSNAVKWYRFRFSAKKPKDWEIPLKLRIQADGDGLIYLNGQYLGRYSDIGPQTDFYLPENRLRYGKDQNVVAVMLRPSTRPAKLLSACVIAYQEFSVRHNKVAVELQK